MNGVVFILLGLATLVCQAQVIPKHFGGSFDRWLAAGETNLFARAGDGMSVAWDSSKANSYFYLPLGLTLTRADDFDLTFVVRVDALELGTTPGKADTFEIAAGLLNLTNALDPQFFRGSGVNVQHGARSLVEFDYFPASEFITATVAPTMATTNNQILFSDNHPMELSFGAYYKVQMSFTATDQTLRSRLWKNGSGPAEFPGDPVELKPLVLSANYNDFAVDTLALINYSDEGQNPPQFSGSLKGSGTFWNMEAVVYNRPAMTVEKTVAGANVTFESSTGWRYHLESKLANGTWRAVGETIEGTGLIVTVPVTLRGSVEFFRVSAERL